MQGSKPEYLSFAGVRPRAAVLPPPRRFLTRRAGPGWPALLVGAISALGAVASIGLLLAGESATAAEIFTASVLMILTLLV